MPSGPAAPARHLKPAAWPGSRADAPRPVRRRRPARSGGPLKLETHRCGAALAGETPDLKSGARRPIWTSKPFVVASMKTLVMLIALAVATEAAAQARIPSSKAEIALSFAPVVRSVVPSVVNIYARRVVESHVSPFAEDPFFSRFFGSLRSRPRLQRSLGSGVILGRSGFVVSNFHVVGNATDIRVVLPDRREFDAHLVLGDAESDLAVLRLVDAPELPALELADSNAVEAGDLVLAIGNPFGVGQTVSSGIVSANARSSQISGRPGYFIQTDAPINPGNSGGALVDMSGRLVGINTAIMTRSGGSHGIGFAIPANLVRQYVMQAEAGRRDLVRPWAGIAMQPVDGALAGAFGLEMPQGVLISALHRQSPFGAAGLQAGDVVIAIDGHPVDDGPELLFRLLALGVGDKAEITYMRDSAERRALVDLAPAPETPPGNPFRIRAPAALAGLSVANVNPVLIESSGLPVSAEGVAVTAVEGPARRTRLRPGDMIRSVNGTAISDTDDLRRIVRARVSGYAIDFERNGRRGSVRLRSR